MQYIMPTEKGASTEQREALRHKSGFWDCGLLYVRMAAGNVVAMTTIGPDSYIPRLGRGYEQVASGWGAPAALPVDAIRSKYSTPARG